MTSRRGFLLGVTSLLAAPAIVRASSIMPVKALPLAFDVTLGEMQTLYRQEFVASFEQNIRLLTTVRREFRPVPYRSASFEIVRS